MEQPINDLRIVQPDEETTEIETQETKLQKAKSWTKKNAKWIGIGVGIAALFAVKAAFSSSDEEDEDEDDWLEIEEASDDDLEIEDGDSSESPTE